MRVLFTFFLFSVGISSNAQIPSYVPTNGLVGWWPFNGNANDESGNGNNGTVNGTTLTTDRFGNAWKAYEFDGVSSNIDLGITPSINSISNDFTLIYWVKCETPGTIFANYSNQGGSYWRIISTLGPNYEIGLSYLVNQTWQETWTSSSTIPPNQWTLFCFTRTGGNTIIFINGVNVVTNNLSSYSIGNPTNPPATTKFGYNFPSGIGGSGFYKGVIDDIAIYNRALTQQEITQLYTGTVVPTTPEDTTSNVGIGTIAPKRKLHVNDVMRLEPRDTAPANPAKGDIYFDGVLNKLRYFNGTTWVNL